MKTLIILGILSYLYGAIIFYKTVVKEAKWDMLEVNQSIIQYVFSGLFFICTIVGGVVGIVYFAVIIFDLIIKYLP